MGERVGIPVHRGGDYGEDKPPDFERLENFREFGPHDRAPEMIDSDLEKFQSQMRQAEKFEKAGNSGSARHSRSIAEAHRRNYERARIALMNTDPRRGRKYPVHDQNVIPEEEAPKPSEKDTLVSAAAGE